MLTNSADPNETARYESALLDPHCLPNPIRRDVVLKGLMSTAAARNNVSSCVPDSKGSSFVHINY